MTIEWIITQMILVAAVGVVAYLLIQVKMLEAFRTVILAIAVFGLVLWFVRVVLPRLV